MSKEKKRFDQLNRYLFDDTAVRGELVQLDLSFQQMMKGQQYPKAIQSLLGELMVASSLLTATLKFEGEISVQLQGDGPVKFATINGNNKQQLRGVARWQGDIADDATLPELLGKGTLIITISPDKGERYQGVVALEGESLAHCLENYFQQSEQLNTKLWIFAGESEGLAIAGGMLLQELPNSEHADNDHSEENDDFNLLAQLTNTLSADELFSLDAKDLLYRLYHDQKVRLFDPQAVSFFCGCSKERSSGALKTVAQAELNSIIQEQGSIVLHCDYCGKDYMFDEQDVADLHLPSADSAKTLH